jgi:signal recognition particle subunit SRP54
MGDIVTLVEKAQEQLSEEKAVRLEAKIRKSQFTLEDFLDQLQEVKKMGPLQQVMGMFPGMNRVPQNVSVDERALVKLEAIIQSMTTAERRNPNVLNGSRRKRIAAGSGTTIQDVNKLMKQFEQMQKMMKTLGKGGKMSRLIKGMNMPAGF